MRMLSSQIDENQLKDVVELETELARIISAALVKKQDKKDGQCASLKELQTLVPFVSL